MRIILLNDTEIESHHGCSRVKNSIEQTIENLSWSIVKSIPTGTPLETIKHSLEKTESYDAIIINGEGTLHDKNPYSRILLSACIESKNLTKKVILLNSSIYLTNHDDLDIIKKYVDLAFVRSKKIQKNLLSKGISSTYAPDLSFYEESTNIETTAYKNNNETPSHPTTQPHIYTDSVNIRKTAHLIFLSIKNSGKYIPFFHPPHEKSNPALRYLKRHFKLCESWEDRILALPVFLYNLFSIKRLDTENPQTIDNLISNSEQVTTGRFHTACFCIRLGIPFNYISSNTLKIEELIADCELEDLYLKENDGRVTLCKKHHQEYKLRAKKFKTTASDAFITMSNKLKTLQGPAC